MRIALNEKSQTNLLQIMQARGVINPTHMVNLLITEALQHSIPAIEDSNGRSKQFREAA